MPSIRNLVSRKVQTKCAKMAVIQRIAILGTGESHLVMEPRFSAPSFWLAQPNTKEGMASLSLPGSLVPLNLDLQIQSHPHLNQFHYINCHLNGKSENIWCQKFNCPHLVLLYCSAPVYNCIFSLPSSNSLFAHLVVEIDKCLFL